MGHPPSPPTAAVAGTMSSQPNKATPDATPALPRTTSRTRNNKENTMAITMTDPRSEVALDVAAVNLSRSGSSDGELIESISALDAQKASSTTQGNNAGHEHLKPVQKDTAEQDGYCPNGDRMEIDRPGSAHTTNSFLDGSPSDAQCKFDFSAKTEEEIRIHGGFMEQALDMARLALKTNETPVGCVLVHDGRVVAKGMNATNVTRNGTRHAELMAVSALISYSPPATLRGHDPTKPSDQQSIYKGKDGNEPCWGDVDPTDGHLYPYGQKLHPSPRVSRSLISECVLYVTVEPCVMCASLLRQLHIKKVYFGAVNDKFGGTGGVFRIHKNSSSRPHIASAPESPVLQNGTEIPRPSLVPRAATSFSIGMDAVSSSRNSTGENIAHNPAGATTTMPMSCGGDHDGDGGIIEPGYDVEGGWGRDAAVTLLRQFYVQENGRAPAPRKKEGRAARLAAMMERDGHAGGPMSEAPIIPLPGSDKDSASSESPSEPSDKPEEDKPELALVDQALIGSLESVSAEESSRQR